MQQRFAVGAALRAGFAFLLGLGSASASANLVVNEVDYDQAGTDAAEFVEIKNVSASPVTLSDYRVELVNGSNSSVYQTFALPPEQLAAGDYFVICANAANTPNCDLDVTPDTNLVQNGDPDGVRIVLVADDSTVDGLSYEGNLAGTVEGTGSVGDTAADFTGIGRLPDGADSNDNSADFGLVCITPGYENIADTGSCTAPVEVVDAPTITIDDVTLAEGDAPDTTNFIFTVTLDADASAEFSVTYMLVDGDATGGVDYDNTGSGGTVTFTGGDAGTQQIIVPVIGDAGPEADETFSVVLSNVSAGDAVIGDDTGLGTITNDDAFPPQLSVDSRVVFERDAGMSLVQFTITLDADASEAFFVTWQASDGTATAADNDYIAANGIVAFDGTAGETEIFNVPVLGDLAVEADETFTVTLTQISGSDAVFAPGGDTGTGTILNDDAANTVRIHDVQGAGATGPLSGQEVKISGAIVTALTMDPPADANGFFMQTADADVDGLDATSEGIFVFTGSAPTVAVGDVVTVIGQAAEFFDQTQISSVSVLRVDGSVAVPGGLPTPVEFSAASGVPSTDPAALSCPGSGPGGANNVDTNFECFEGMRVTMPDAIVTRANLRRASDLYAEVFVMPTGQRSRREQGVNYPALPVPGENAAAGQFDSNPELIEMDADEAGLMMSGITAGSTFSATGVIGFSFGDYEFYPTELSFDSFATPEAVMPSVGGNELTVGSFNMLFLCDNTDGTGCNSQPDEASKLTRLADYVVNILDAPDVLGVQEVENQAILDRLAAEISTQTMGAVAYTAILPPAPGSTQNIGFLLRDGRIDNPTITQFFAGVQWDDPAGSPDILHDRPPLLLEAEFLGPDGPYDFAVLNNHTKARSCTDGNCGVADAERDRAKRFFQARDIAQLVQDFQTASGLFAGQGTDVVPLILVGDYNAFEYTDGYVDVVGLIAGSYDDDANECNATLSGGAGTVDCNLGPNIVDPPLYNTGFAVPLNERISYLFTQDYDAVQGSADRDVPAVQVLDHILLARTAQGFFLGTDYGVANNVVPDEDERNSTDRVGSSDHDGVVTYLDFNCTANPILDGDNDLVCGMLDNCPADANAGQEDLDGDGAGDACDPDIDGDGAGNGDDNCPVDANPGQENFDGDAFGDACDEDIDDDGVANGDDAFPLDPNESADSDSDGIGDNADNCPLVANPGQEDGNGDGVGDACAVAEIAVELGADLAVAPGSDFEVTVNVTSAGPQPAEGASLVLQVPANVQFVGLDTSGSPVCDSGLLGTGGGTISCELGEIAALDELNLTFRFTALAASSGSELAFDATVATTTGGDASDDNAGQAFVTVGAGAPNGEIFSDDFEG